MTLAQFMELSGFSDNDVATTINVNRSTVNRIRRARQRPDWPTLDALYRWTKGAVAPNDFLYLFPDD